MQLNEIVPLTQYLGVRANDDGLIQFLRASGHQLKLKVVEHTAGCSFKKAGFSLSFIQEEMRTVEAAGSLAASTFILRGFFLYSNGHEGFSQYNGALPERVSFFDPRAMVKVKLGEPNSTSGGNKFGSLVFPLRDTYRFETCSMSLSYHDEKVIMVTFTTLQEADRLAKK